MMQENSSSSPDLHDVVLSELEALRPLLGGDDVQRRIDLAKSIWPNQLPYFRALIVDPSFAEGHILSIFIDLLKEINDVDNVFSMISKESAERTAKVHDECVRMRRDGSFPQKIGFGSNAIHRMILIAAFLSTDEEAEVLRVNLGTALALIESRPMTYRHLMAFIPQLEAATPLADGVI